MKNNADIQRFLDEAHEQTAKSGETCNLVTFNDFWDKKYGADELSFDKRSFLNDVSVLLASNQITYYQELTSYKKGIAPVVYFFKRIIRKICAFLFLPLVAAQNAVNMSVARVAIHIRSYVNREETLKLQLQKREKELETQIVMQQKQIAELTRTVNQLTERIDGLASGGDNK